MNTTLPGINTLAQVHIEGGLVPLPSRIEDCDGDDLTIAAPTCDEAEPVGTVVTLRWSCDLGQMAVRGVVTRVLDGRLEQWIVRTSGHPRVVQPRAHERVTLRLQVTVDLVERRPPARFTAESLDLGRGGLRLRTEEWVLLEHGEKVRLRLGDDEPAAIAAGTVVRPNRVRSVLEFAIELQQPVPERAGLLLRRMEVQAGDAVVAAPSTKVKKSWWRR
jgi:hypothetical protein